MSDFSDDLTSNDSSMSSRVSVKGIFEHDSKNVKGHVRKMKNIIICLSIAVMICFFVTIVLIGLISIIIIKSSNNDKGQESFQTEYTYRFYHHNEVNSPSILEGVVKSPSPIEEPLSIFNMDMTQVMLIVGEEDPYLTIFECLVDVYCCPSNITYRNSFEFCKHHQKREYYWASTELRFVEDELMKEIEDRELHLEAEIVCPVGYDDMIFHFLAAQGTSIEQITFECYGECERATFYHFKNENPHLLETDLNEAYIQRLYDTYSSNCQEYSTTALIIDDDGITKSSEDAKWKMKDLMYFYCSHVVRVNTGIEIENDEKVSHFCIPKDNERCEFTTKNEL